MHVHELEVISYTYLIIIRKYDINIMISYESINIIPSKVNIFYISNAITFESNSLD